MQYLPCNSALLAQETLLLTQKGTFFAQRSQNLNSRQNSVCSGLKFPSESKLFGRCHPCSHATSATLMIACHHHKFSLSWKILLMMNHIHRLDRQPLNGLLLTYTCPNLHHHFHSSPLWSREVQIHLYLCAPPCLSYHHCHTFVIVVLTMIDDHGLGGQRLEQNHKTRAMALVICK